MSRFNLNIFWKALTANILKWASNRIYRPQKYVATRHYLFKEFGAKKNTLLLRRGASPNRFKPDYNEDVYPRLWHTAQLALLRRSIVHIGHEMVQLQMVDSRENRPGWSQCWHWDITITSDIWQVSPCCNTCQIWMWFHASNKALTYYFATSEASWMKVSHWDRNQITTILQTTFWYALSSMLKFKFHNRFTEICLRVQITTSKHYVRYCLSTSQIWKRPMHLRAIFAKSEVS